MSDLPQLPALYWNMLSHDDRCEYVRLRQGFHQGQKTSSKDRRIVTFRKELNTVVQYLERNSENKETRCVLCGVCFAGKVVCVNTRQLKSFLCRCKSSINGSFQQLGYVALRTKAKARQCVLTVLPSLQNHQNILRQWTVRVISDDALFCFVTSFSQVVLPEITPDDLFDEKKPGEKAAPRAYPSPPVVMPEQMRQVTFGMAGQAPPPVAAFKTKSIEYDLPSLEDTDDIADVTFGGSMVTSFSMNFHDSSGLDLDTPMFMEDDDAGKTSFQKLKKSKSADLWFGDEWNMDW